MARIRTIKPEFFTSEDIVSLSPLARILYIALWCESDKEGRLLWKPRTFKMRYLPADSCDIEALCAELVSGGLVRLYGEGLAYIPAFTMHQHINPRESASQLPAPAEKVTRQARVGDASARDSDAQGGREGKGKERNTRDASVEPDGFDAFWAAYPNKRSKQDASKAWAKLKPSEALRGTIHAALQVQAKSASWLKDGGQFVPHAATWINGKRWADELDSQQSESLFGGVVL
jgi:hypothetical protein